jgi:hypothetical protein
MAIGTYRLLKGLPPASVRDQGGKRKKMLIKNHIPRDVYTTRGGFKAFLSFVLMTIPQENTSFE